MDGFAQEAVRRLPLAEAVLLLWRWLANESFLQQVFVCHRGRSYKKVIDFALFVHLIADALLEHRGSGNQSFQRARDVGQLPGTTRAAYGKLARIPIGLSKGFFADSADRLLEVFPAPGSPVPESLREFEPMVVDGKKIKHVAKRLKPVRNFGGKVLGGKALVAVSVSSGLAVGLHAHPDGEMNDCPLVPELLAQVRVRTRGNRLWVLDRQFCDLTQPERLLQDGDHFVMRYHPKVHFSRDESRPEGEGQDGSGRRYVEAWGWLGSPKDPRRCYVRRITLARLEEGDEDVILVTDLLDATRWPAVDLLAMYLQRWGIEKVFQKITEVFHLQSLISSTPEGTIFQLAFCLLLYNMIEVLRAYVAEPRELKPEQVSMENLFYDVHRQLIAWAELVGPPVTVSCFPGSLTGDALRARLRSILAPVWTPRWLKAPRKKRRSAAPRQPVVGGHTSVYRILQLAKAALPGHPP